MYLQFGSNDSTIYERLITFPRRIELDFREKFAEQMRVEIGTNQIFELSIGESSSGSFQLNSGMATAECCDSTGIIREIDDKKANFKNLQIGEQFKLSKTIANNQWPTQMNLLKLLKLFKMLKNV